MVMNLLQLFWRHARVHDMSSQDVHDLDESTGSLAIARSQAPSLKVTQPQVTV